MQTHLIETTVRCGAPVGFGSQYREKVTCPACLAAKDPFELLREFHHAISPLPEHFAIPDDREWRMRATKCEEESNEFMMACFHEMDSVERTIWQVKEAADAIIAHSGFILAHGLDLRQVLTVVVENCMERQRHGMEDGEFCHTEAVKKEMELEGYAKLAAVAWRKGQ